MYTSRPRNDKRRNGVSFQCSNSSNISLPQLDSKVASIVRNLTCAQSAPLHRRRWRRLLGPRRRRWWWCLFSCSPVWRIRTHRPAGRSRLLVTVAISIAMVVKFAVRVFEDIGAVRAIFGLGSAEIQSHVGDLRGVCRHAAERAHVWWRAGAVAERCRAFEAGGITTGDLTRAELETGEFAAR